MDKKTHGCGIRTALITVADTDAFLRSLRTIMQARSVTIVCFNADNMAGLRHAESALGHAIRSFRDGNPIAKTLEMEALLYASGTRQCTGASAFGIHAGKNRAYICCCPDDPAVFGALGPLVQFVDNSFDELGRERILRLKDLFAITDEEIAAAGGVGRLQDLVIERVALLDAYR